MNSKMMYVIYLILFPIAGIGVGYVFYWVYLLLGNNASDMVFDMFIVVWFSFGVFAGLFGCNWLRKINRQIHKK
ncbi:hypothetical protein FGD67_06895 [Colwellia sp. M166]|jgi:hypothetical protein|uniref:hypothetical protein n=1 Tax=Colwellia sp. M166 TaxID=2583805 RepID=UPI00211DE4EC|nr:hypothetical protein [Colwellia sp. M166]UUO22951.1 hypothetical protein FGD67_06895 [Colwellia sp. M166]|tara:strand:+ start:4757 stop:4978 length:222 start_codon:yes stop_codon:yes gene_type:complete